MFEITYWDMLLPAIIVIWIIVRVIAGLRRKSWSLKEEAKMLLVLFGISVIARIVYFPWHHVNGKIGTLKFDVSQPLKINLVPIIHLFEIYDGWQMNIIGNITMFIPIGIFWPLCFKELRTVGKSILAGFGFSLFIEITQLAFYERCSDVDDLILNTLGYAIGTLLYFGVSKLVMKRRGLCNMK